MRRQSFSALDAVLVMVGALFALISNIAVAARHSHQHVLLTGFLALAAGCCWVVAAWRSFRATAVFSAVACAHAVFMLAYAAYGGETFFGGAMTPVIAGYAWVIVTAALATCTAVFRIRARQHD